MPNIEDVDFLVFLSILSITLVVNYLLFRKLLFSWVDPIWFFVIINTTVTISLVTYDRLINSDFESIIFVVVSHLFFIMGALITKWAVTWNLKPFTSPQGCKEVIDSRSARWLLNVSSFILFFVFAYYVATGLPALNSDPELARVMTRREGGGAITRLFNVFSFLSLTLWFYIRLKRIKIGWISSSLGIVLPFILLLTVGGKASLVSIYISFFYVSYYVSFETGRPFNISAKPFLVTAISILCVSFLLLYARAEEVGATTSSMEFAGLQLLQRIIFSGIGAYHYFSTNIPDLNQLNLFDYFYQYLVLPLFAPLRLISYEPTVGSILAISMVGDDTFGPNPSMYVEGKIYFGWVAGVLYCGALGIIFSMFRYYPLKFNRLPSFVRVVAFSFGCMLISTMTYDMILFVGEVINSFFLLTPILLGVMLVNELISSRRVPQLRGRQ